MWTNALMSKCVRFFFRMCNVLVHAYLCIHIYTSLCTFAGVSSFCASKCSANLWICVDVHSFTIFLNCETSLSVRPCIFFHRYTQALGNTLLFKLIWQSTRKEISREAKRCSISDKGFLSEWKHVRLLSIARTNSERPVHGSAVQRYAVLVHAAGLARSLARLTGRLWVKEITCCLMRW